MNKTYIANEKHPYIKVGVEVNEEGVVIDWTGMKVAKPKNQPDWYDEVKEEPTVSEDEERKVMEQICTIYINEFSETLELNQHNLARYLAKLEKRISKAYKGE